MSIDKIGGGGVQQFQPRTTEGVGKPADVKPEGQVQGDQQAGGKPAEAVPSDSFASAPGTAREQQEEQAGSANAAGQAAQTFQAGNGGGQNFGSQLKEAIAAVEGGGNAAQQAGAAGAAQQAGAAGAPGAAQGAAGGDQQVNAAGGAQGARGAQGAAGGGQAGGANALAQLKSLYHGASEQQLAQADKGDVQKAEQLVGPRPGQEQAGQAGGAQQAGGADPTGGAQQAGDAAPTTEAGGAQQAGDQPQFGNGVAGALDKLGIDGKDKDNMAGEAGAATSGAGQVPQADQAQPPADQTVNAANESSEVKTQA